MEMETTARPVKMEEYKVGKSTTEESKKCDSDLDLETSITRPLTMELGLVESSGNFDNVIDFSSQLGFKSGDIRTILRNNRSIVMHGLLIFCLCLAVTMSALVIVVWSAEKSSMAAVYGGSAANLENAIVADFSDLTSGTQQLVSYVTLHHNCSDIEENFLDIARQIVRFDDHIIKLEILPSYVLKYSYSVSDDVFTVFNGEDAVDYLTVDNHVTKDDILIAGLTLTVPSRYPSFVGSYANYNIWMPAESYDTDIGCNLQPTNCSSVCYDNATKMKYYGTVRALVDLRDWFDGTHPVLTSISNHENDLEVTIEVVRKDYEYSGNTEYEIYSSGSMKYDNFGNNQVVRRHIKVDNLDLEIVISPRKGWTPVWAVPLFVVLFFLSMGVTFVAVGILITNYRHDLLLMSILPRKVIKHFTDGKTSYAENHECVTIFFSGEVNNLSFFIN
jgi:hypothetical protein